MLKKEQQILEPFVKRPWEGFTFNQIKKLSNKSSNSYVYVNLKKYVKAGFLKEESVGNVIVYKLNLEHLKTHVFAAMIAEYAAWEAKHIPKQVLEKLASKMPVNFFILLVTGSYAKNTQKEGSDFDVVIICDDQKNLAKKIRAEIRQEAETSIPVVHFHVFTKKEFLEMLLKDKENFGKEVTRNNLIFHGGSEYYWLLAEAMKNGFTG